MSWTVLSIFGPVFRLNFPFFDFKKVKTDPKNPEALGFGPVNRYRKFRLTDNTGYWTTKVQFLRLFSPLPKMDAFNFRAQNCLPLILFFGVKHWVIFSPLQEGEEGGGKQKRGSRRGNSPKSCRKKEEKNIDWNWVMSNTKRKRVHHQKPSMFLLLFGY